MYFYKVQEKTTIHTILFNIFASIAIASACGVIISKNPIYSLALLVLTFCNATGLLLLFRIELLAMMFIIIYVGAIAVLFLFVVMMLNIKGKNTEKIEKWTEKGTELSIIISSIIITIYNIQKNRIYIDMEKGHLEIKEIKLLWENFYDEFSEKPWNSIIETITNIQAIGNVMYTYYFYYFILAGMILLIAMIGAIVLTMYKRKNAWKKQMIYRQISRTFENSITKAT